MEKEVANVFTNDILESAFNSFQLDRVTKDLNGFENYVFEVTKEEKPYILRITHSSHRTKEEILAELDWMNYLQREGINVPTVYLSQQEKEIVSIEAIDGTYFYACLFSKAKGFRINVHDESIFNEKLFFTYGKTIGKMHKVTKSYQPNTARKRAIWKEDDLFVNYSKYIDEDDWAVLEQAEKLLVMVKNLPKNKDNFGLIHTDLHQGNFFYDGEDIYPFDFDDSAYMWYSADIAIPLYYLTRAKYPNGEKEERQQFADTFLTLFIAGYESVTTLPTFWKEQLPLFLKLRDLTLYLALNKKIAKEDRNEKVRQIINEIRERIIRVEPIVHIK